jgi:hypothetical protein
MALLIVHFCENQSLETQRNDKIQTDSCLNLMTDELPPYYLWMSENKMSEIIKKWNNSGKYGPHYITSLTQKSHIMG